MLYDESAVIPDASWDNEYVPFFNVNVDDTLTTYAFALNIRHMDDYDYSNLYVFMHVEYPNDSTQTYIINCPLAHPDGQWMGKGGGTMVSAKISLNKNWRFPLKGEYHFEIEQAMREKVLDGIVDVGISFEKQ